MTIPDLKKWFAPFRTSLAEAVAKDAAAHVKKLQRAGRAFYGYALHPGDLYEIQTIAAVTNTEEDLQAEPGDDDYQQYRLNVNEWQHWEAKAYPTANRVLAKINQEYEKLLAASREEAEEDEDEDEDAAREQLRALGEAKLEALLEGLEAARDQGVFGADEDKAHPRFLIVWLTEVNSKVVHTAAKRLNSPAVAKRFRTAFDG